MSSTTEVQKYLGSQHLYDKGDEHMSVQDPTVQAFLQRRQATRELLPVSALKEVPETLREIATEVMEISGDWNAVEFYTADADGREREEQRFMEAFDKGETYNPQFTYSYAQRTDMQSARMRLQELERRFRSASQSTHPAQWFGSALMEKIRDDLATCDMVDGLAGRAVDNLMGDALTKRALESKYWQPDDDLLQRAEQEFESATMPKTELLSQSPSKGRLTEEQKRYLKDRKCDAKEIQKIFTSALERYNLLRSEGGGHGFAVVVSRDTTAIDVRHRSLQGQTVFLPEKASRTGQRIIVLTRHEIEGHARQAQNGWDLFGIRGGRLTCDDETLYEGLAMTLEIACLEEYFGPDEEYRIFSYAYPTAVAHAQQGGSFHDVFSDQLDRYLRVKLKVPKGTPLPQRSEIDPTLWKDGKDDAYYTTYRVMRGHIDTTNPYGYAMAKDLAYERGQRIHRGLVTLGFGHYNEAAIMTRDGLLSLAGIDLKPEDLPFTDRNVADELVEQMLKDMQSN
ncbi:MAG: hypothetical protein JWM56_596 [Candidatus Peribacteria bacterium]|nr:hypothetical protein [Candidatus Peribacteria bacterium]